MRNSSYTGRRSERRRSPDGSGVNREVHAPFCERPGVKLLRPTHPQNVARAYHAQCTPDFFAFNAQDELQYRGRLDASRIQPTPNARCDLFEAMKQVAETGRGPEQ